MALTFEPECRKAIEFAKKCLNQEEKLDHPLLLAALYHGTELKEHFPSLADFFQMPLIRRQDAPEMVKLADGLKPVFTELSSRRKAVGAEELFLILLRSDAGRHFCRSCGISDDMMDSIFSRSSPVGESAGGWHTSGEREEAIRALSTFGRMLTTSEPPHKGVAGMEKPLAKLYESLVKMGRRSTIIHGPPGCGKSALVYELARRIYHNDDSLPELLKDLDIFELSPSFLRSGASVVGQYEERVKGLISVLENCPKIVLFIDEIHSFFQSGIHERGPFSDANESFKGHLGRGTITCIGCTTTVEYRHYIEPDGALARRFSVIKLDPPSSAATVEILKAKLPRLRKHYDPMVIPEEILSVVVEMADEYLPGRYQPDKSIQLLDQACAAGAVAKPPAIMITKEFINQALEATTGRSLMKIDDLGEEIIFQRLQQKIVGQDSVLLEISRAFVAGLGGWKKSKGPRGSFVFFGPTGTGKTQTAAELARIMGDGKEALLRVDCNTLLGSGHDSGPALNRLIGPPPGYIGYVRGEGGILSRIRDMPECIVLFDEIEKADPGVGKILLQILDEGKVEDSQGSLLDFRRALIIFTTNAGCTYDAKAHIGFTTSAADNPIPIATIDSVTADLRARGFGEEFFGRHLRFFYFGSLSPESALQIIERQLHWLRDTAELKGFQLCWTDAVIPHLTSCWQPRFGVRHLTTILRNRIVEQLSLAEAQGELLGVKKILLKVPATGGQSADRDMSGFATRSREGDSLEIDLA